MALTALMVAGTVATAAGPPLAELSTSYGQALWKPQVKTGLAILIVRGPEGLWTREVFAGEGPITFDVADLGDGSYSYQLELYPPGADRLWAEFQRARKAEDEEALARISAELGALTATWGVDPADLAVGGELTLRGGQIAPPDRTRPVSGRLGDESDIDRVVAKDVTHVDESAIVSVSSKVDVVHLDDVIVEGSLCASFGSACANGESFLNAAFAASVKVKGDTGLWFNDTDVGDDDYAVGTVDSGFFIENITDATVPLLVEDDGDILLDDNNVIIGRAGLAELSLSFSGVKPHMRIESPGGAFGSGNWNIEASGSDLVFGTGLEPNVLVLEGLSGRVGIGTNNANDRLHVIGGAIIEGDVALGSSRVVKHQIGDVSGSQLLTDLEHLTIHTWRYKDDPRQAQHIGPMAEDFHQIFGLGADDKHLSPTDTSGVALAALKALYADIQDRERTLKAESRDRDWKVEALSRELEEIRAALEAISDRVSLDADLEGER